MDLAPDSLNKLRSLAADVSQREGCMLYDLEFTGSPQGRVLRVFIDKETGSASLDDCANVSRGLNLILDVEDVVPGGAYDLEVSTPGIERKLTQKWHYEKATGKPVRLKLREPSNGRLVDKAVRITLEGTITELSGEDNLILEVNGATWTEPLSNVAKGQILFIQPKKELPGKRAKR